MIQRPSKRHTLFHDGRRRISHIVFHAATGDWIGSHECLHHMDGNPFNNELSNLQLMIRSDHAALHKYGANNPRWKGDGALPKSKYRRILRAQNRIEHGKVTVARVDLE